MFYDVNALVEAITSGALRSVVVTKDDHLVGHMGITIRHPGTLVCETGNTVVHPEARGRGLLMMLAVALQERVQREGFVGYVHYPTTAHEIMQRASVARGGQETGVMLAYVAADTEYEAIERNPGRLAATVVYQPIGPMPHRVVILPNRYRILLQEIYDSLGIERSQGASADGASYTRGSEVESTYNERRSSLHVFACAPSPDIAATVRDRIQKDQPVVTYLDLPLDDPKIDGTVAAVRREGFHFCALLPDFAHTDVLRLQALHDPGPQDFAPDLANEDAQRICAYIRNDAPLPSGAD